MEVNAGRLDQAVYWARRALPLAPNIAGTHYTLALPVIFLDATAAERYLTTASRRFPAPGSPLADYLHSMLAVIDMPIRGWPACVVRGLVHHGSIICARDARARRRSRA